MRITRGQALNHCDRCKRVKDNCKHLSRLSEWTTIRGRFDKGAFKVDRRKLYIAIDGSSTFREWLDNLNVSSRDGAHRGFAMAATDMLADLMRKLPRSLATYKEVLIDGHSRGGGIGQYMAYLIRKVADNQGASPKIEVITSGSPVLWRRDKAAEIEKTRPYIHHAMRTARDIVDDVNAPRGFIFRRVLRRVRLYHYTTYVYDLPTVHGKIDHLAYREATKKSKSVLWG